MSASINAEGLTLARFQQRAVTFFPLLLNHFRTHGLGWLFAGLAFYCFQANYAIGYNSTPSLPFKLFLIHFNEPVDHDGYIAFHWHGGAPYPDGLIFTKRVVGKFGDKVVREGRQFSVNGQPFVAKEYGISGRKLTPADLPEGVSVIPRNKYWVMGTHEYSLDSRYDLVGLVDQNDVVGRAYPIF